MALAPGMLHMLVKTRAMHCIGFGRKTGCWGGRKGKERCHEETATAPRRGEAKGRVAAKAGNGDRPQEHPPVPHQRHKGGKL